MQQTLFDLIPSIPTGRKQTARQRPPKHPDENLDLTLAQTLFGPIETKAHSRNRAKRIVHLLGAIEEAPLAVACWEHDIALLEYFIERSERTQLGPNDRDGLLRFVGDLQELLTEEECRQMRENKSIWRPYPPGWLGMRPGDLYAAALHAREIAYLRNLQAQRREDREAITDGVKLWESELLQLQKIGPLPEDLAQQFALTAEGTRRVPKGA